jgi:hypothetical protein
MAKLQDTSGSGNSYHLFDVDAEALPPKGTFKAKVIDIKDVFGVERRSYDDPSQMEKVDLTAFLFGFRDKTGQPHKIDTRPMKISGNEKSNLYGFLKALTGSSPAMGWDYCELKGTDCLITVEHVPSKKGDRTYAQIATVSPLPEGWQDAPASAPKAAAPRAAAPAPAPAPAPVEVAAPADDPLPF